MDKDGEMKYRLILLWAWVLREGEIEAVANEKLTVFLKGESLDHVCRLWRRRQGRGEDWKDR